MGRAAGSEDSDESHFCSNKDRGAREETAAASVFQKHPLEKGNRCALLTAKERAAMMVTEASTNAKVQHRLCRGRRPRKEQLSGKTLEFDPCLHHFL